jgi:hypothetical protein
MLERFTTRMMLKAPTSEKTANVLVGTLLAVFALGTIAFGAFSGFPVQDDTYLVRLQRLGGGEGRILEHHDRPIVAFLVASSARWLGERPAPYIAIALAFWAAFAAVAVRFWRRLFPEWRQAWPAVALAAVSPLLTVIQFTTVTTVFPDLLPVLLLLGALLLLFERPDDEAGWAPRIVAAALAATGVAVSEYGLASAIACTVFLLLRGRRRAMWTLVSGAAAGYGLFRWISDVRIRGATDPQIQIVQLVANPWPNPLRALSAAWYSLAGAWGSGLGAIRLEWSSKSTLVAALVAVLVAGLAAALASPRPASPNVPRVAGRVIALVVAVVAGLVPVVIIQGWPFQLVYESRFLLPVVVFATCATVATALRMTTPAFQPLVVFLLCFIAANRLVDQAFEEKRLQARFDGLGSRVRPFLQGTTGLVVLVTPDQTRQSAESSRFWIVRPTMLARRFESRAGCPDLADVRLPRQSYGWERTTDRISLLLWDPGESEHNAPATRPVAYFAGCPSR